MSHSAAVCLWIASRHHAGGIGRLTVAVRDSSPNSLQISRTASCISRENPEGKAIFTISPRRISNGGTTVRPMQNPSHRQTVECCKCSIILTTANNSTGATRYYALADTNSLGPARHPKFHTPAVGPSMSDRRTPRKSPMPPRSCGDPRKCSMFPRYPASRIFALLHIQTGNPRPTCRP